MHATDPCFCRAVVCAQDFEVAKVMSNVLQTMLCHRDSRCVLAVSVLENPFLVCTGQKYLQVLCLIWKSTHRSPQVFRKRSVASHTLQDDHRIDNHTMGCLSAIVLSGCVRVSMANRSDSPESRSFSRLIQPRHATTLRPAVHVPRYCRTETCIV